MREKFIRAAALLLALVLTAALLPAPVAHAAEDDLAAIVEEQIRAYADSIDQSEAADHAASALATHGIKGGGNKLSVGASHPLTATLMNSEMLQDSLIRGCTVALRSMQQLDLAEILYGHGYCTWHGSGERPCAFYVYSAEEFCYENIDFLLVANEPYAGRYGSYDESLEWMAGIVNFNIKIVRSAVSTSEATYTVTCTVYDCFDFDTASSSGFAKLISGLGALLFREFDWEATASFDLTIPYSCDHSSGNYHWTYDPENRILTSDGSEGYTENGVNRHSYEDSSGSISYYHELEETVRLRHDQPWVLEYDIKNPGYFLVAPISGNSTTRPALYCYGKSYLFVYDYEYAMISEAEMEEFGRTSQYHQIQHYYGTPLSALFSYTSTKTYTFRLENVINPDGSNMICLTAWNTDTGELLLDRVPMDDYYRRKSWEGTLLEFQSDGNDWVSGQDIFINYIGNESFRFSADYFDLRIWENGEGGESVDYFETETVAPTCTEGYTLHTCAACGYSYKTDFVPANPHTYTSKVTPPTCAGEGYTTYSCTACSYSYKADPVPATGHEYTTEVTLPTCTGEGYTTYTCTVCNESHTGDTVAALNHSYSAGYCSRCGSDTVTATIADGQVNVRATRGIKTGTWVLVTGYAADGRMMGLRAHLWEGSPQTLQTIDLPEGEIFKLFFVKQGTWVPLRTPVIPQ